MDQTQYWGSCSSSTWIIVNLSCILLIFEMTGKVNSTCWRWYSVAYSPNWIFVSGLFTESRTFLLSRPNILADLNYIWIKNKGLKRWGKVPPFSLLILEILSCFCRWKKFLLTFASKSWISTSKLTPDLGMSLSWCIFSSY